MLYILNEYYYKIIENIQKWKEAFTRIKGDKNVYKEDHIEDIYGYEEDIYGYKEDIYGYDDDDDVYYDDDDDDVYYEYEEDDCNNSNYYLWILWQIFGEIIINIFIKFSINIKL